MSEADDIEAIARAMLAELDSQKVPMSEASKAFPLVRTIYYSPMIDLGDLAQAAYSIVRERMGVMESVLLDARMFVDLVRLHWGNWHDDAGQVSEAEDCIKAIDAALTRRTSENSL